MCPQTPPPPGGESRRSSILSFAAGAICGAVALHYYGAWRGDSSSYHVPGNPTAVIFEDDKAIAWE